MSGWTDDRVELVTRLWKDGCSASQIAKQVGGTTRNAVLGILHRRGLSNRPGASAPARTAVAKPPRSERAAAAPRAARSPRPAPGPLAPQQRVFGQTIAPPSIPELPPADTVVVDFVPEAPGLATTETLGRHMCKWPIGDPSLDSFTYCGRRAAGSYCDDHRQVAHSPAKKTSDADLARSLRRYI